MDNDNHNEVSKLLLIDQSDYNTQHIFFDDQADPGEDCIVDVRDFITKKMLSYNEFINTYVVKVEPQRAILEPDYFIKMIEMAEQSRDEEINRVENQIEGEEVQKPALEQEEEEVREEPEVESEWEKIQKMPNDEYLMRTVLPVVYQGMKVVDKSRPVDPIEYLAMYILKHQDMVQIPQAPAQM